MWDDTAEFDLEAIDRLIANANAGKFIVCVLFVLF